MDKGSLITDEMRRLICVLGEPVIYRVEEGAIQRYAKAMGDANPLYNDIGYARKSEYGRLICPPGFTALPEAKSSYKIVDSLIKAGAPQRMLAGGIEYEFLETIGAGEMLVVTSKLTNISERETNLGKAVFSTIESSFLNQNGNIVARGQATIISY